MSTSETDRDRFAELFRDLSPRIYGFVRRGCDPTTAHDVTAETFTIAWRRFEQLPSEPLPWLFGIARNVLRNQVRGEVRRDRLVEALKGSAVAARTGQPADVEALERTHLAAALSQLSEQDREALLLVAWDGLTTTEAAAVAGCSTNAFAARLSRARARLTRALGDEKPDPPPRLHDLTIPPHPTGRYAT